MEALKTTLHEKHVALGAKMTPFAGWQMPLQYSGIIDEHKTVRENVGVFDVSHMGEFFIIGPDALKFLETLVPQQISDMIQGKALYSQLTNNDGNIIDDLIIYKIDNETFLLIVNASRIREDLAWIERNKRDFDIEIRDISNRFSLLAIQGPNSSKMMEKLGLMSQDMPKFFFIKQNKLLGFDVYISRTGYTGEDGFEILISKAYVNEFWDAIFKLGKELNIKPIGLGARDTLRLEAALHLYGNDMDETTTPIEASLGWSVAKDKKEEYSGKAQIIKQLKQKPKKKLIGFEMIDRAIPRHGYNIFKDGEKIGNVTSGGISPILGSNIGLGYIDNTLGLNVSSIIEIEVRGKFYKAKIVKRPFITKSYSK